MATSGREVLPREDGSWEVRRPGASRASARTATQAEAIERARTLVQQSGGGDIVVHDATGRIRSITVSKSLSRRKSQRSSGKVANAQEAGTKRPSPKLRGANALLRISAELEQHRALVEALANLSAEHVPSPATDRALQMRRWLTIFSDELEQVRSVRNKLAHGSTDVTEEEVTAALAHARRLDDLYFSQSTAATQAGRWLAVRGHRVVDSDQDPEELLERLTAAGEQNAELVYQEASQVAQG